MPIAIVEMFAERTEEQKSFVIRGNNKVFEEVGIKPEHVQVIIHEVPRNNWALAASKHLNYSHKD